MRGEKKEIQKKVYREGFIEVSMWSYYNQWISSWEKLFYTRINVWNRYYICHMTNIHWWGSKFFFEKNVLSFSRHFVSYYFLCYLQAFANFVYFLAFPSNMNAFMGFHILNLVRNFSQTYIYHTYSSENLWNHIKMIMWRKVLRLSSKLEGDSTT